MLVNPWLLAFLLVALALKAAFVDGLNFLLRKAPIE